MSVLIAGGGMVGASLGVALSRAGVDCRVVEAVPHASTGQPSYDERHTALAWGSRRIFEGLGLWEALAPSATAISEIHASERGRFAFARIRAEEQGVPALGYVVPNRAIGAVLTPALAAAEVCELMAPARVVAVEPHADTVAVTVEGEAGREPLTTRLLVVADGARSAVREQLGIQARVHSYGQAAVIGNLTPARPLDGRAYERFTADGPLALLPLGEDRCNFVWTVPASDADRVRGLDDAAFLGELQAVFGWRQGRFRQVGARSVYPLERVTVEQDVAGRAVVIGNAAHSLHPIAGQGFNLGLRDVACLVELVAEAYAAGDAGDAGMLARYSDWRRRDRRLVTGFTDGLARLFVNDLPGVGLGRDLGMLALDLLPGMKDAFARQTMGRVGRQPRLARGLGPS